MTRPGELVLLRNFHLEWEARIAAAALEANGIPTQVVVDTAGGAYPNMAYVFPIRLLVRPTDVEIARQILDTPAPPPEDESDTQGG